jgi:flagellar P-ring protein precursor FlgI
MTRQNRLQPLPATALILTVIAITASSAQAVQIGDLVRIKGSEQSKLVGMGLVVGLKGTGDGGNFRPAMEPLANVVRHFIDGTTVAAELKDAKNVALVALEATTPTTGVREGDLVDVHVSAIGTAKSLRGGRLLMMPMTGPLPDSPVFAYASGRVAVEDEEVPTVGVIRQGAQIRRDIRAKFIENGRMTLVLNAPNATFQVADTIASTINDLMLEGPRIARAVDQKNVVINLPPAELRNPAPFISEILSTVLDPAFIQTGARVRINEKTGTIVMSGDVQISPVSISHGGLTISMITPRPKATAQAPQIEESNFIGIDPEQRGGEKLSSLIAAFNQLKVPVKDRIAIIKEIYSMGKLHAQVTFE